MKKCALKRKTPLKAKTGFKRTTGVKKKSVGKKKKKPTISALKKKLWTAFSAYIRKRDENICFTCGVYAEGSNYHAGHFVPKSVGGLALYFHEDNVHGQCMRCNIHLGGNQFEYGKRLGLEKAEELIKLKQKESKWTVNDYLTKIDYYESLR